MIACRPISHMEACRHRNLVVGKKTVCKQTTAKVTAQESDPAASS